MERAAKRESIRERKWRAFLQTRSIAKQEKETCPTRETRRDLEKHTQQVEMRVYVKENREVTTFVY